MGQAKARGSKDQRVAEAVERARVAEIARKAKEMADRKAEAEMLARRQAAWELRNAERLARGEEKRQVAGQHVIGSRCHVDGVPLMRFNA